MKTTKKYIKSLDPFSEINRELDLLNESIIMARGNAKRLKQKRAREQGLSSPEETTKKKRDMEGSSSDSEEDDTFSIHSDNEDNAEMEAWDEGATAPREELLATIKGLEDKKKALADGKTMTPAEFQLLLVDQTLNAFRREHDSAVKMAALARSMRQMERRLKEQDEEIARLRALINKPEINVAKRGIIVRGIAEKADQTEDRQEAFKFMQNNLGLNPETVEAAFRLPLSKALQDKLKQEKKTICKPILFRFRSLPAKFAVMKKLPNLQKVEGGKNIGVSNDVPLCLKAQFKALEDEGREIRKANDDIRTRVIWEGDEFVLEKKAKGEGNPWIRCNVE